MSEQLPIIKELAAKRSVLFVEDDEKIIKSMQSVLESIFGSVFICKNGEDGLLSYEKNSPDLVLTDIQMPKMDGIAMAEKIRQSDEDIPIIIMSAYSDEAHLMDSIYIGIDRYIKKPIDDKKFFAALMYALRKVENEEQALAYQSEKLARAINETAEQTLKDAMNIFPSPTFVFDKEELYFINVHALELFSPENLQDIYKKQSIDPFVIKKQGTLQSLFDVSQKGFKQNKLVLQTPSGRQRVYWVYYTSITTAEGKALHVYTLSDITRAEYENQKSKNLSTHLQEAIRFYRKQRKEGTLFASPKEQEKIQESVVKEQVEEAPEAPKVEKEQSKEQSYEEIRFSAMHHEEKMDAKTYMQDIDEGVRDEMDELEDIEKELIELLEECAESFSMSNLEEIAAKIESYARTIGLLMDFEDIAFSLDKLYTFLRTLNVDEVDSKKMLLLLGSIADDLRMWRQSIFVSQSTVDIHYLDASLLSSCLQIETEFGEGGDDNSQSDELELF